MGAGTSLGNLVQIPQITGLDIQKVIKSVKLHISDLLKLYSSVKPIRGQEFQLRLATADFRQPLNHNDLKVAGHKSITIIHFLPSEIVVVEKMVSLSNNDRFDNDKIFLHNSWHFFVITRINYVSIFFIFILKIHERTSLSIYEQCIVVIARCRLQYNMNVYLKHYKHFEWKRMLVKRICITNIILVLNEGKCASRTLGMQIWNYMYKTALVFNI